MMKRKGIAIIVEIVITTRLKGSGASIWLPFGPLIAHIPQSVGLHTQ